MPLGELITRDETDGADLRGWVDRGEGYITAILIGIYVTSFARCLDTPFLVRSVYVICCRCINTQIPNNGLFFIFNYLRGNGFFYSLDSKRYCCLG